MSSPFAIAAVTAVLRDLLNNGLNDQLLSAEGMSELGNVLVTALPPDRISTGGADEQTQLNLYMYQVSPNSGWRNIGLPSHGGAGERLTNAPLAIDLHYLVSAYGAKEFHADALLGYAMHLFHENPVLTRKAIRATLKTPLPAEITPPPGLKIVFDSDLADQIEQVKITPHYLTADEISKLWMAFQAKYRPSAAYHVSVVLIESKKPARTPLPVLTIGKDDSGPKVIAGIIPPFPEVEKVDLPDGQISALLGDEVKIAGHHLTGDFSDDEDAVVNVVLSNPFLGLRRELKPSKSSNSQVVFTLPNIAADYPAGEWRLSVTATPKDKATNQLKPDHQVASVEISFPIAPEIVSDLTTPINRANVQDGLGDATIQLKCVPHVHPQQRVTLRLGESEEPAGKIMAVTNSLTFIFKKVAAGDYRVQLLVDGVESHLIDRSDQKQPKFDETQKVKIQ